MISPAPARRRLNFRVGRSWSGRIGLGLGAIVILIAVVGPLFAPYSPSELLGAPYQHPTSHPLLGTDFLARDVFSRVLWGGRTVIVLAGAATLLAYLVGIPIGLVAGISRSFVDPLLMRIMDVFLAFPPIILLLVLATGVGPSPWVLVVGVAITHVPGISRIVRTATLEVVRARLCRGSRRPRGEAHVHPQARGPAQHRLADPRRCGHPPDGLDPARRLGELPRARAAAAGRGLGA